MKDAKLGRKTVNRHLLGADSHFLEVDPISPGLRFDDIRSFSDPQ